MSLIQCEVRENIGSLCLNNVSKRNALSQEMVAEILQTLQDFQDRRIAVVILRASDDCTVWSAGHDIHELPRTHRDPLGYDDSLDVVGVHMIGGIWGAIATGLFASKAINAAASDGLFFGNPGQLVTQVVAVGATLLYSFVASLIILYVVKAIMGVRVTEEDEVSGVDLSAHGEAGYNL